MFINNQLNKIENNIILYRLLGKKTDKLTESISYNWKLNLRSLISHLKDFRVI
jgi:hypothetical protein